MTAREVMDTLGVSRMTLHNYVKAGKVLVDSADSSRTFSYNRESVMKLAESKSRPTARAVFTCNGEVVEFRLRPELMAEVIDFIKSKVGLGHV